MSTHWFTNTIWSVYSDIVYVLTLTFQFVLQQFLFISLLFQSNGTTHHCISHIPYAFHSRCLWSWVHVFHFTFSILIFHFYPLSLKINLYSLLLYWSMIYKHENTLILSTCLTEIWQLSLHSKNTTHPQNFTYDPYNQICSHSHTPPHSAWTQGKNRCFLTLWISFVLSRIPHKWIYIIFTLLYLVSITWHNVPWESSMCLLFLFGKCLVGLMSHMVSF